jgi:hypothetical protein
MQFSASTCNLKVQKKRTSVKTHIHMTLIFSYSLLYLENCSKNFRTFTQDAQRQKDRLIGSRAHKISDFLGVHRDIIVSLSQKNSSCQGFSTRSSCALIPSNMYEGSRFPGLSDNDENSISVNIDHEISWSICNDGSNLHEELDVFFSQNIALF